MTAPTRTATCTKCGLVLRDDEPACESCRAMNRNLQREAEALNARMGEED